jgi:hypothetical protein
LVCQNIAITVGKLKMSPDGLSPPPLLPLLLTLIGF